MNIISCISPSVSDLSKSYTFSPYQSSFSFLFSFFFYFSFDFAQNNFSSCQDITIFSGFCSIFSLLQHLGIFTIRLHQGLLSFAIGSTHS